MVHGDSGYALDILPALKDSTVFWLDGHFSDGITGKGKKACPLLDELDAIFRLCICNYTILIDDFRLLGNDPAYPTVPDLISFVASHSRTVHWENDIIPIEGETRL